MKISKKWKKLLEISSFYISVPKIIIICYTVPEIWHMTDVTVVFHFGLYFPLLPPPPNTPKKSKFKKNEKKHMEMSSFYTCVPKIIIRWCMVPEIWCTSILWFFFENSIIRADTPPWGAPTVLPPFKNYTPSNSKPNHWKLKPQTKPLKSKAPFQEISYVN